jgi:hypothetical protein
MLLSRFGISLVKKRNIDLESRIRQKSGFSKEEYESSESSKAVWGVTTPPLIP